MSKEQRKSRRRFLADMLFLGGGLTAAGLLAKSQLMTPEPEPVPAGAMPATPCALPESTPTPSCSHTPDSNGIPPGAAGGMEMPVPPPEPRSSPGKDPFSNRPQPDLNVAGRMVLPAPSEQKERI